MRIVLLGAPGAGKGTVAKQLMARDGSCQLATGDLLRAAVKDGTALGKAAETAMRRGDLVPDRLIMEMVEARLGQLGPQGFVLDGFPRTIPQAVSLEHLLKRLRLPLDLVVNLVVPEPVILDRLTTRRTCSSQSCQEIHNLKTYPPAPGDTCRRCGSPVIQRDDETPAAIAHRVEVYHLATKPLVGHYRRAGLLLSVEETATEAVLARILAALDRSPAQVGA